ncbi:MAG: DUF2256 domain-containing protein [Oceanococcaceae bacterium]
MLCCRPGPTPASCLWIGPARPSLFEMPHHKPHLPSKICSRCGRPFAWRRKWAACWEAVRYCSKRCRGGAQR